MKRDARGKRPQFYQDPALDQMMGMIMVLAGEVAVLADQLDSTQRVLANHNIDARAEVDALVLDDAALEAREARRQQMLERMFYLVRKEASEAAFRETTEGYIATLDAIAEG